MILALFCPAVFGQVVKIAGVPDWNQPPTYAAANDSFVQPFDPPPHVAQVANWCTPTAAANMMGWFEDQKGYAGLGDGLVYSNRQQPYPNNDTSGIGIADGIPDWKQNKWMDGIIEMGYQMDTQGWLNNVAHFGTKFGTGDCPRGILTYLNLYYPAEQWTTWQYEIFGGVAARDNSWNDYLNGGFAPELSPAPLNVPNDGLMWNSSPVLVTVDNWVDVNNQNMYDDGETQWYDWSSQSTAGGHTVIGMGYALNYDPDGPGGILPQTNWLIAHDGWGTTGADVAVPWDSYFENSLWWANTHAIPEPATLALLLLGCLALVRRRRQIGIALGKDVELNSNTKSR